MTKKPVMIRGKGISSVFFNTLFLIGPVLIVILSSPLLHAADGNFYLRSPLKKYTPYSAPISSVFDHSIKGKNDDVISKNKDGNVDKDGDGKVVAYTGETGTSEASNVTSRYGAGYKQEGGKDFRLHGNYGV